MAWNWGTCETSWYNSCPPGGSWESGTGAIDFVSCFFSYIKNNPSYEGDNQNSVEGMYDYWLRYQYLGYYQYNPLGNTFNPTEANSGCTITELEYLNIFGYCACTGAFDRDHTPDDGYTPYNQDGTGGCCKYQGYNCMVEGFCNCDDSPPMPTSFQNFQDLSDTEFENNVEASEFNWNSVVGIQGQCAGGVSCCGSDPAELPGGVGIEIVQGDQVYNLDDWCWCLSLDYAHLGLCGYDGEPNFELQCTDEVVVGCTDMSADSFYEQPACGVTGFCELNHSQVCNPEVNDCEEGNCMLGCPDGCDENCPNFAQNLQYCKNYGCKSYCLPNPEVVNACLADSESPECEKPGSDLFWCQHQWEYENSFYHYRIDNQGMQVPWPSDVPCPCPSGLDESMSEVGLNPSELYMMGFHVFDSADVGQFSYGGGDCWVSNYPEAYSRMTHHKTQFCDSRYKYPQFNDSDGDGLGCCDEMLYVCSNESPSGTWISGGLGVTCGESGVGCDCPGVMDDCGICDGENDCFGCLDAIACNYDPEATIDNGECWYIGDFTCGDGTQKCCNCDAEIPQLYCEDLDGDMYGCPDVCGNFCSLEAPYNYVNNDEGDCDTCDGDVDSCGICNGPGDSSKDCHGNCPNCGLPGASDCINGSYVGSGDTGLDICGVCGGNALLEEECCIGGSGTYCTNKVVIGYDLSDTEGDSVEGMIYNGGATITLGDTVKVKTLINSPSYPVGMVKVWISGTIPGNETSTDIYEDINLSYLGDGWYSSNVLFSLDLNGFLGHGDWGDPSFWWNDFYHVNVEIRTSDWQCSDDPGVIFNDPFCSQANTGIGCNDGAECENVGDIIHIQNSSGIELENWSQADIWYFDDNQPFGSPISCDGVYLEQCEDPFYTDTLTPTTDGPFYPPNGFYIKPWVSEGDDIFVSAGTDISVMTNDIFRLQGSIFSNAPLNYPLTYTWILSDDGLILNQSSVTCDGEPGCIYMEAGSTSGITEVKLSVIDNLGKSLGEDILLVDIESTVRDGATDGKKIKPAVRKSHVDRHGSTHSRKLKSQKSSRNIFKGSHACTNILGDVNNDGVVNILDVVELVNHILGNNLILDECGESNADVNGDGTLNVLDIVTTVNLILGGRNSDGADGGGGRTTQYTPQETFLGCPSTPLDNSLPFVNHSWNCWEDTGAATISTQCTSCVDVSEGSMTFSCGGSGSCDSDGNNEYQYCGANSGHVYGNWCDPDNVNPAGHYIDDICPSCMPWCGENGIIPPECTYEVWCEENFWIHSQATPDPYCHYNGWTECYDYWLEGGLVGDPQYCSPDTSYICSDDYDYDNPENPIESATIYNSPSCDGSCPSIDVWNGAGSFCVDVTHACCLYNFPREWFDRYSHKINDWNGDVDGFDASIKLFKCNNYGDWSNCVQQGNTGPIKNIFDVDVEDGFESTFRLPIIDGPDNNTGEGQLWNGIGNNPYEQPILGFFGESCDDTNVWGCSTCSMEGYQNSDLNYPGDCDIRGLLPRLEHHPVVPNGVQDFGVVSDDIISSQFNSLNSGEYDGEQGYPLYLSYCSEGSQWEYQFCAHSSGLGGSPNYGCNDGSCGGDGEPECTHQCKNYYQSPSTLYQTMVNNYGIPSGYEFLLWDRINWETNPFYLQPYPHDPQNTACQYGKCSTDDAISCIPGFTDDCPGGGDCLPCDIVYNFNGVKLNVNGLNSQERLLMKMYDYESKNTYDLGCITATRGDSFGTSFSPYEIKYFIDEDRTCDGGMSDGNYSGECSHNGVSCDHDKQCQIDVKAYTPSGEEYEFGINSCVKVGCMDYENNPCELDELANVHDPDMCWYPTWWFQDVDGDGATTCDGEAPSMLSCYDPSEYSEGTWISCSTNNNSCYPDGSCESLDNRNHTPTISFDYSNPFLNDLCSGGNNPQPVCTDPSETCPGDIFDHCGICCDGGICNNICNGTIMVDGSEWGGDTLSLIEANTIKCECDTGELCYESSSSTGQGQCSGSGFDCAGYCSGKSEMGSNYRTSQCPGLGNSPYTISEGHHSDCQDCSTIGMSEENGGLFIKCHSDYDRDGQGCCFGQPDYDVSLLCPGVNTIDPLDRCPCGPLDEDECYHESFSDMNDTCDGFIDPCTMECVDNYADTQKWYGCPDFDTCYPNERGIPKTDDCGECMSLDCCDGYQLICDDGSDGGAEPCGHINTGGDVGILCNGGNGSCVYGCGISYEDISNTWRISNGNFIVNNPCQTLFGEGNVPSNMDWNDTCVDCKGYPGGNGIDHLNYGNIGDSTGYCPSGLWPGAQNLSPTSKRFPDSQVPFGASGTNFTFPSTGGTSNFEMVSGPFGESVLASQMLTGDFSYTRFRNQQMRGLQPNKEYTISFYYKNWGTGDRTSYKVHQMSHLDTYTDWGCAILLNTANDLISDTGVWHRASITFTTLEGNTEALPEADDEGECDGNVTVHPDIKLAFSAYTGDNFNDGSGCTESSYLDDGTLTEGDCPLLTMFQLEEGSETGTWVDGPVDCINHCCAQTAGQLDSCAVCNVGGNTEDFYTWFPDGDGDGLSWGAGVTFCESTSEIGNWETITECTPNGIDCFRMLFDNNPSAPFNTPISYKWYYDIDHTNCTGSCISGEAGNYFSSEEPFELSNCSSNYIDCFGVCDGDGQTDACGVCMPFGMSTQEQFYADIIGIGVRYGAQSVDTCNECLSCADITDCGSQSVWREVGTQILDLGSIDSCTNEVADNYICNRYPCLSGCGGDITLQSTSYIGNDDDPDAQWNPQNYPQGGCAFLKIISPVSIYEGYDAILQVNSDNSWNKCDGIEDPLDCYHRIDTSTSSDFADVYTQKVITGIDGDSYINLDEFNIDINHLSNGGQGYLYNNESLNAGDKLQFTVAWPSGCSSYIEDNSVNNNYCIGFSQRVYTIEASGSGCKDGGILPSCDTYCNTENNTCINGPVNADGSLTDGKPCQNTQDCRDYADIDYFVNCFPDRPVCACTHCSDCLEKYPDEVACNYSQDATHHNGECIYRTDVCEDCDMDGLGCAQNKLFACPPGESGDGYIGNHSEFGWPSDGCNYTTCEFVEIGSSDEWELVSGGCQCSSIATIDSFEIGKCYPISDEYVGCKGGQFDYQITNSLVNSGDVSDEINYGCTIDDEFGGHTECPNIINFSTDIQYSIGSTIPGFRDNCGMCKDIQCGPKNTEAWGPLANWYNGTNHQELIYRDINGTIVIDGNGYPQVNNACIQSQYFDTFEFGNGIVGLTASGFVPNNVNWNMSCTGCTDVSADNYPAEVSGCNETLYTGGTYIENPLYDENRIYDYNQCTLNTYCLSEGYGNNGIVVSYDFITDFNGSTVWKETDECDGGENVLYDESMENNIIKMILCFDDFSSGPSTCTRSCVGGTIDGESLYDLTGYGFDCPGRCEYNPHIKCYEDNQCFIPDESNSEICNPLDGQISGCHQYGDCNFDDFIYDPTLRPTGTPIFNEYIGECDGFNCQGGEFNGDTCISHPEDCVGGLGDDGCCNSTIKSQGPNCCCEIHLGCPDPLSPDYEPCLSSDGLCQDCIGQYRKDCLFGFTNDGDLIVPKTSGLEIHAIPGQTGGTSGNSAKARFISGWAFGNHRLNVGDYFRVGDEVMILENITTSSDANYDYDITVMRGAFNTCPEGICNEWLNQQSWIEHTGLCNYQCCQPYEVFACLDPLANNYFCYGKYGFGVVDETLCPSTGTAQSLYYEDTSVFTGLLPNCVEGDTACELNEDQNYTSNSERILLKSCDDDSHDTCIYTGQHCCCEYRHDCAGNPCYGMSCDKYTGNAYYDFCGNCIDPTEDIQVGYENQGCGCGNGEPPVYYYDGDGDGYGCGNIVKSANVAQILSQMYQYWGSEIGYCKSNPVIKCFSQVDDTHMYGECNPESGNQFNCEDSSNTLTNMLHYQCDDGSGYDTFVDGSDCAGYDWAWGQTDSTNDMNYCLEPPTGYIDNSYTFERVEEDGNPDWYNNLVEDCIAGQNCIIPQCTNDMDCRVIDVNNINCWVDEDSLPIWLSMNCMAIDGSGNIEESNSDCKIDLYCDTNDEVVCTLPGNKCDEKCSDPYITDRDLCVCGVGNIWVEDLDTDTSTFCWDTDEEVEVEGTGNTWTFGSCRYDNDVSVGQSCGYSSELSNYLGTCQFPLDIDSCELTETITGQCDDNTGYCKYSGWRGNNTEVMPYCECETNDYDCNGNCVGQGEDLTVDRWDSCGECGGTAISCALFDDNEVAMWVYNGVPTNIPCDELLGVGGDFQYGLWDISNSLPESIRTYWGIGFESGQVRYCNFYDDVYSPAGDINSKYDCHCDCNGTAIIDECGICVGGNTGIHASRANIISDCQDCTSNEDGSVDCSYPYDIEPWIQYGDFQYGYPGGWALDCNCECDPETPFAQRMRGITGYGTASVEYPMGCDPPTFSCHTSDGVNQNTSCNPGNNDCDESEICVCLENCGCNKQQYWVDDECACQSTSGSSCNTTCGCTGHSRIRSKYGEDRSDPQWCYGCMNPTAVKNYHPSEHKTYCHDGSVNCEDCTAYIDDATCVNGESCIIGCDTGVDLCSGSSSDTNEAGFICMGQIEETCDGQCIWGPVECPTGCGECTNTTCSYCHDRCDWSGCSDPYSVNFHPFAVGGANTECFDTWLWHTVDSIDDDPKADCAGWTLERNADNDLYGKFVMDGCDGCTTNCGGKWRVRDWRVNPFYGPENYAYPGSPAHPEFKDGDVPGMYRLQGKPGVYPDSTYQTGLLSNYQTGLDEFGEANFQHIGLANPVINKGMVGLGSTANFELLLLDVEPGHDYEDLSDISQPQEEYFWTGLVMPQTPSSVFDISVKDHLFEFDMKMPSGLMHILCEESDGGTVCNPQVLRMVVQVGQDFESIGNDNRWWDCGGDANSGIITTFMFDDWTAEQLASISGQWVHVRIGMNRSEMGTFNVEKECVGSSTFDCQPFSQTWDSNQIAYDDIDNGVCGNGTSVETQGNSGWRYVTDSCDLFNIKSIDELHSMCADLNAIGCNNVDTINGNVDLRNITGTNEVVDTLAHSKWIDPIINKDRQACIDSPYVEWVKFGKTDDGCTENLVDYYNSEQTVTDKQDAANSCMSDTFSDGAGRCKLKCDGNWCPDIDDVNAWNSVSDFGITCKRSDEKDRCISNFTFCGGWNPNTIPSHDCTSLYNEIEECSDYSHSASNDEGDIFGVDNKCEIQYTSLEISDPIQSSLIEKCGGDEALEYAGMQNVGIWFKKKRAVPLGPSFVQDYGDSSDMPCYQVSMDYDNNPVYVGLDREGYSDNGSFNADCGVGSWGFDFEPEITPIGDETPIMSTWPAGNIRGWSGSGSGEEGGSSYVNDYIWFDNFRISANRIESGLGGIEVAHLEASNAEWGAPPHLYGTFNNQTDISWQYDNSLELGIIDDSMHCLTAASTENQNNDLTDGNPGNLTGCGGIQGTGHQSGLRVSGTCMDGGKCEAYYYQGDGGFGTKQSFLENSVLPLHTRNLWWRASNEASTSLGGSHHHWYTTTWWGGVTQDDWTGEYYDSEFGDWVRNTNECKTLPTTGRQPSRVMSGGWMLTGNDDGWLSFAGLFEETSTVDWTESAVWGYYEGDSSMDEVYKLMSGGNRMASAEMYYMPGCGSDKFSLKSFPNMGDPCHTEYECAFDNPDCEWAILKDGDGYLYSECADNSTNCNLTSIVNSPGQCASSPYDRKICRTGGDSGFYDNEGDKNWTPGDWSETSTDFDGVYHQYSCSDGAMSWNDWHSGQSGVEGQGTIKRWEEEYGFVQAMQARDNDLQEDILNRYFFPRGYALSNAYCDGITNLCIGGENNGVECNGDEECPAYKDILDENSYYYFSVRGKGKTGFWSSYDGLSNDTEYWAVCTQSFIAGGAQDSLSFWNRAGVNHAAQLWLFPLPKKIVRDTWLTSTPTVVMWGKWFGECYNCDDGIAHNGGVGDTDFAQGQLRSRHPEIFGYEPQRGPLRNATFHVFETPKHSHSFGDGRDRIPEFDKSYDDSGSSSHWKTWPGNIGEYWGSDSWSDGLLGNNSDGYEVMYGQYGSCSSGWCMGDCIGTCFPNFGLWGDDVVSCDFAKRLPKNEDGDILNSFFGTWYGNRTDGCQTYGDTDNEFGNNLCGKVDEGRFTPYPVFTNYGNGGYESGMGLDDLEWGFDDPWWQVRYAIDGTHNGMAAAEWWNWISFAVVIYPPRYLHLSKNTYNYSIGTCLNTTSPNYKKHADGTSCVSATDGFCTDADYIGCPENWTDGYEEGCPETAITCCEEVDNGSCWIS